MGTTGLPPTERDRIRALEQRIDALEKATRLASASIGEGGIRLYGGGDITLDDGGDIQLNGGDIIVAGSGTAQSGNYAAGQSGWKLFPDGNAEFNSLTLRDEIIGNQALSSPVVPEEGLEFDTGFSIVITPTMRSQVVFAVPEGYTKVVLLGIVTAQAVNPLGTDDVLGSSTRINGNGATQNNSGCNVPPGKQGNVVSHRMDLLTGLSGGNVTVDGLISNGGPTDWGASASNAIYVDAMALFFR